MKTSFFNKILPAGIVAVVMLLGTVSVFGMKLYRGEETISIPAKNLKGFLKNCVQALSLAEKVELTYAKLSWEEIAEIVKTSPSLKELVIKDEWNEGIAFNDGFKKAFTSGAFKDIEILSIDGYRVLADSCLASFDEDSDIMTIVNNCQNLEKLVVMVRSGYATDWIKPELKKVLYKRKFKHVTVDTFQPDQEGWRTAWVIKFSN